MRDRGGIPLASSHAVLQCRGSGLDPTGWGFDGSVRERDVASRSIFLREEVLGCGRFVCLSVVRLWVETVFLALLRVDGEI